MHACPAQVQEKLAISMMREEEERMYDTMHEAEYRRMETRWGWQRALLAVAAAHRTLQVSCRLSWCNPLLQSVLAGTKRMCAASRRLPAR
jgi:hypothetical protein